MKATAIAPSNIAFIKYWGKKNELLRLPENGSISLNLSNLLTTTTVEFSDQYSKDLADERVVEHLNRVRQIAKINQKAKVVTKNNFPSGSGLSSSASGFAALTLAGAKAAGLNISEKELSILARQGSGSACRSIPDGFVEWLDGDTSESSYAVSIYPSSYWEIVDVVVIVSKEKKEVSTTEGQKLHVSSPFFEQRLKLMKEKIKLCKKFIREKNFSKLGELAEQEALEMHAIMLTSSPSLIYWTAGTLTLMKMVKEWRKEGLESYFTINTGQNIHILCLRDNLDKILKKIKSLPQVQEAIINTPSAGAKLINKHLF